MPGENNTVELTIPENASYKKSDVSEINDLVSKYLTAKAACDQATLQSLVTDPTEFDDMSVLENSAKYLKGFEDTTCYLADGYAEGEYVVVELSYMDIADVESKPLDIVTFYIITDQDGSYKIANGELSNAQLSYLNSFKASKDIQDIYVHVKENTEYLLDTDKTFRAFYDLISKPATTENTAATPEDAQ